MEKGMKNENFKTSGRRENKTKKKKKRYETDNDERMNFSSAGAFLHS